ncbi:bax inhibitor 1-like [Capsicum annuum]|uniref:bax inhibitor 1-like n=1 Tax=Capsicum annuum TaxID=4072 RepID=UPI001FB19270|nr:bax inhibitor 1-like [Capsicum annuum]
MAMNALNSYFKRNWNKDDIMNLDEIDLDIHRTLKNVYLTLFGAMLSCTFGFISVAGGNFTVLSYVASLILLYFTPPGRIIRIIRILFSMLAAYSFGAFEGVFTNYLFKIEQSYALRFFGGITMGIGNFLYEAKTSTERINIYIGFLKYCFVLMITGVSFTLLDINTALWMIIALFMGYLVLFSQEILYDANVGDINFVNCTLTVFFNLPAIVIHAARLHLQGAENE